MMNKYSSRTIYCGNLMEHTANGNFLYKKDVLLLYDEVKDTFYSYLDTFNLFLSRDLDNLTKEELEGINNKIKQYMYPHVCKDGNSGIYVEEASIRTFISSDKKLSGR